MFSLFIFGMQTLILYVCLRKYQRPRSTLKYFAQEIILQHSCDGCPQVLSQEQQVRAASNDYNFDHPDAFDFDLLTHTLRKLKQGKSVKIPVYDFTTHGRQKDWVRMIMHFVFEWIACQRYGV